MGNLKLADDEYTEVSSAITSFGSVAEDLLVRYLTILCKAMTEGMVSGETATNFARFTIAANQFEGKIEELTTTMSNELKGYVSEIEVRDTYLY